MIATEALHFSRDARAKAEWANDCGTCHRSSLVTEFRPEFFVSSEAECRENVKFMYLNQ